ncbi:MAG: hypothetical protein WBC86_21770, partial [Pseudolabrys sp.]
MEQARFPPGAIGSPVSYSDCESSVWIEGRTIAIEYRWAEGSTERLPDVAAEFARLKVDVIVTAGTPAAIAAKQATSVIP